MKNKVLKRLMILVLAVVMVVGGAVNVYALEVEDGSVAKYTSLNDCLVEYGFPEIELEDGYKYIFAKTSSDEYGYYYILKFVPDDDFDASVDSFYYTASNYKNICILNSTNTHLLQFTVNSETGYVSTGGWSSSSNYEIVAYNYTPAVYYSDVDIYYKDSDSLFFQQTPLLVPTVLGMKAEKLTQMILPTMNPVVGSISLVVCLAVLSIGLRKGLSLLWTALHKA